MDHLSSVSKALACRVPVISVLLMSLTDLTTIWWRLREYQVQIRSLKLW